MTNSPLMATAFPILVFAAAFLMLGLAKLGIVKITNVAAMCFVAGIVGSLFALYLYTVGLPHLVGLLATAEGAAPSLGDTLGPLVLQLASAVALFSMLFIMVGFQGTGIWALDITATGLFAAIIGFVTLPFGLIIFGSIQLLGVVFILYSAACILLGLALKFNTGIKIAAVVVIVGCLANIGIALGFQFGML